uniref:Chemokine (C-X-C motif) receptor 3, tandem duplicate 3 n=1 Tax=Cyprinus carpio TaxID=7962 RepID=A0A8C2IW71_CYPCA
MQVDLHGLFENNNTFDYGDYEYKEVVCPSSTVSGALAVFMPLLYSAGILWGLLGNGLVLVILFLKRLHLSVMDIFILLLSVTDSLLLFTLPLWAVDAVKGWTMGAEVCKLSGVLFEVSYCWLVYVLGKLECIHSYPPDSWRLSSRFPHLFVLPLLLLLCCCSFILLKLRHNSKCQQKKKGQRAAIIAVLVLVFFICWTPYNITFIVNTVQTAESISSAVAEECEGRQWTASKITAVFGLLHCVVNPVIYLCLSKEFRHRVLTLTKFSACETESNDVSLWDSSVINRNTSVQEEQGSLQPMNDINSTVKHQDHDT